MHANGTLDDAAHAKITMRDLERNEATTRIQLSAQDIRQLRDKAHMSQAVFAKVLNMTVGYVSKLERGTVRPTGATLKLLNIIRQKGIDAVQ